MLRSQKEIFKMGLRDIFTRKSDKTPEYQLLTAVNKLDIRKVQSALAAGANPNAQNTSGLTALDFCAEKLRYLMGTAGEGTIYSYKDLDQVKKISLIWDDLVKAKGTLNKYKDDSNYANGNTIRADGTRFAVLAKPPRPPSI